MRPSLFIASSVESKDVAYAIQENLDFTADVTVWDQNVFELSNYSLDSLVTLFDEVDFGAFVFCPDDIAKIRNKDVLIVRDNVLFELGLCIGKIGRERTFIIIPRGYEKDFHLPSDLLGITPATYEPKREDGNLTAALGPTCNKIKRALDKFGEITHKQKETLLTTSENASFDENDIRAILTSWFGSKDRSSISQVIYFNKVDKELGLVAGSTKKFLKEVVSKYNFEALEEGANTILFRKKAPSPENLFRGSRMSR